MIKCPLCNSEKDSIYLESKKDIESELVYKIYKCINCSLTFSVPMKPASAAYYQSSEEWYEEYQVRWEYIRAIDFIGDKKFKILDVGCGNGYFLDLARKKGLEVTGIDINTYAVKAAKGRFGLERIYCLSAEEFMADFPDEKFDMVCLFHLIEHLNDPAGFLFKLRAIIKDNGFIVIAVPNPRRLRAICFKRKEGWDYPPHHLTRWDEKSVARLLQAAGFKMVSNDDGPLSLNKVLFDMDFGIKDFFKKIKIRIFKNKNIKKEYFKTAVYFSRIIRIIAFILYPVVLYKAIRYKKEGLTGNSMLIIAGKDSGKAA